VQRATVLSYVVVSWLAVAALFLGGFVDGH
jgi:hypothetical protein